MSTLLILIALLVYMTNCQLILISNCKDLQNIIPNNSTVTYSVENDIDCGMLSFIPICSSFNGVLEGNWHKIGNVSISVNLSSTGIFQTGSKAVVRNVVFDTISVSDSGNTGLLFDCCLDCVVENVTFTSISSNSVTGGPNSYVGAVSGKYCGGSMFNVTLQNTFVGLSSYNGTGGGVGGFSGVSTGTNYSFCFNLGFLGDPLSVIVSGIAHVGGVVGYCANCIIQQSGVKQGQIQGGSEVASIAGQLFSSFGLCQVYASSGVYVNCSTTCAALVATLNTKGAIFSYINNSYTQASVSGSSTVGYLFAGIAHCNSTLQLSNIYTSATLLNSPTSKVGYFTGSAYVIVMAAVATSNVFVQSQTGRSYLLVGYGSVPNLNATTYNCSQLYYEVVQNFDSSFWGGNRLIAESGYSYGLCSCTSGCPHYTSLPPTILPSTYFPSTSQATTNFPTKSDPTTSFPTVNSESTLTSTIQPDTNSALTIGPSTTLSASTTFDLTNKPQQITSFTYATQNPPSTVPTSSLPLICFYVVPDCQNCDPSPPQVDLTQVNVSCTLKGAVWKWSFVSLTGTFTNNANIVFSQNSTVFIEGNLTNNANLNISCSSTVVISGNFLQNSGGQIVFSYDPSSQNNAKIPLNVGGCIQINGNISLNLETQPQQGTTNFQVISYNCTQQVNISSSQIQVTPSYNGSSCDTINSQTINQPNSLGISVTSTLGNKCNGRSNLGLIIGLAVGIPCAAVVVLVVMISFKMRAKKELKKQMKKVGQQMHNFDSIN